VDKLCIIPGVIDNFRGKVRERFLGSLSGFVFLALFVSNARNSI